MSYILIWLLVLNTEHVINKHLSTESACYQIKVILQMKEEEKNPSRADEEP